MALEPLALWSDIGNVVGLFDLGKTAKALARHLDMPEDRVHSLFYGSRAGSELNHGFLTGAVSKDQFIAGYEDVFGHKLNPVAFWDAFKDVFEVNWPLVDILYRLRIQERIAKLVAVTDADPVRLQHILDLSGCDELFDAVVASYNLGYLKPNRRMYAEAQRLSGLPYSRCAFIDDLRDNVAGANELGVIGLWYMVEQHGVEAATDILKGELAALGLEA